MGRGVNQLGISRFRRISGRTADIVLAAALLPMAIPLCLLMMIAVRVESRGSPLFVQTRIGRGEKPFKMFKLRTMRSDTEDLPSHEVSEGRITRVGRILRKLKLDELPQLSNVFVGSMSLVGPRPCLPRQQELIEARRAHGLFSIRPGVTGPGQLLNVDMSQPQRLADIEVEYFRRATPFDHLVLLGRTLLGKGSGDAVLRQRTEK